MDYQVWMTDVMSKLMKPAKPTFTENRAGKRAKLKSLRRRGTGFTK
ncbi:hypothetical protein [Kitasatospora acidiphila]|nr:hypothetical protein [Kitasatospora acidiphila]